MSFLTARKRAVGLGSAKRGTDHFWHMQVSSGALAILIPVFVITFGRVVGATYDEVTAYFARPFPAIVTGLTLVVGLVHFKNGAHVVIEDYSGGATRKWLVVITTCATYAIMATALYALVRLAL